MGSDHLNCCIVWDVDPQGTQGDSGDAGTKGAAGLKVFIIVTII